MKKYIKHRPFNCLAVALFALGFWFEFCFVRQLKGMFEGGTQIGPDPNAGWIGLHAGEIGLILLAVAVVIYVFANHHSSPEA
jgi:hypothetical protein